MPLVFEVVVSTAIILRIDSTGGGQMGGGWYGRWGQVGSHRQAKANI